MFFITGNPQFLFYFQRPRILKAGSLCPDTMRRNEIPQAAAPMLEVQFGQASDPGKVRTNNEDATGLLHSRLPPAGPFARLSFCRCRRCRWHGPRRGRLATKPLRFSSMDLKRRQAGTMLISLLPRLIQHANAAVHDCTLAPEYRGKSMAHHSRSLRHAPRSGHRLPRRRLPLLSRPQWARQAGHSGSHPCQRTAKLGLISAAEAVQSESRHVLIRSLGREMFVSADTTAVTLLPGDVLILCSDGLHDEMPESEMVAASSPSKRTSTKSPASWSIAPSKSMAATTPPLRSSASNPSSRWACTAGVPIAFQLERTACIFSACAYPFPGLCRYSRNNESNGV